MNFFTAKVFNLFTIALSAIFFLSAVMSIVTTVQNENRITLEFERMLAEIDAFNFNQSLNNSNNTGSEEVVEGALFNNGADAFLHAYYNFIESDSYHVISRGSSTNTVATKLLTIIVSTESKNVMIKYPNGDASYELISYEEGNTYDRTEAKFIYYHKQNNLVYMNETKNVRKVNGDLIATYSSSWKYDQVDIFLNEVGMLPGDNIYEFSKKAITEVTYYKETKVNNKIAEYQVQIKSNPTLAGKTYARVIKYIGNALELPYIRQMKTSAIIDGNGVLKALMFDDEFDVKTNIILLGEKIVKCKSNATYNFVTIGGEVLAPKPDVSNATAR
ncbi:MAG: hypothetical protein CVV59_01870 [Tenericutes bacterium HGW-Tenericutes-4]|nr:MAG: hypothetical protein CVV59_01870 [Tenericutes bacterium HGW-Tenericutes-4]